MSQPALHPSASHAVPRTLALVTALVLGGCVTRTLENGGLQPSPAPADTLATGNMVVSPAARADGQRILRFANDGTPEARLALRRQADARMTATCGDTPHVSAEGSVATDGVVSATGARAGDAPSSWWYIQFACTHDTPSGSRTPR